MHSLVHKGTSGPLPTAEYDLVVNGKKVGMMQLRHRPSVGNGVPPHMESHIYYEVLPEERNKGYAKLMLSLGLEEARRIGLNDVFISVLEDNIPSRRVIEKNGGELVDAATLADGQKMYKYRVRLF